MGEKREGREGRKERKHGTVFKDNWHPNEGFNQGRCPHGIWGTRDSSQHRGGQGIHGDCYASIRSIGQPVQTEQKDGDLRGERHRAGKLSDTFDLEEKSRRAGGTLRSA